MRRIVLLLVLVTTASVLTACSDGGTVERPPGVPAAGDAPVASPSAATSPAAATDGAAQAAGAVDNEFVPDDVNLGDCISSLPRPGCGSESRTSGKTLATLGVLMAGMAFIGWRILRGVRRRDAAQPGS